MLLCFPILTLRYHAVFYSFPTEHSYIFCRSLLTWSHSDLGWLYEVYFPRDPVIIPTWIVKLTKPKTWRGAIFKVVLHTKFLPHFQKNIDSDNAADETL